MRRLLSGSVLAFVLATATFAPGVAEAQFPIRITVAPPAPQVEVVPVTPSPRHVWIPGHWQWRPPIRRHVWVPGHFAVRPAINRVWIPAQWVNEGGYWVFRPGRWGMGAAAPVMVQPQPQPVMVQPQPVYAQPQPVYAQPQPQPVYAQPQPVYAQPQPQPVYAQPQPVYAQPQPGYDPGVPADQMVEIDTAPPAPQVEVIPVAPSASHVWLPGHWQWHPAHRRHVWVQGHYAMRQHGAVWQPAQWVRFGPRWRYVPGHWRRY